MEWLEQQSDANPTTPQDTLDTSPLKLLETMTVNHIKDFLGLHTKFTVSKLSASVGIASRESDHSLSVIYPATNKPPLILSKDGVGHTSALFITVSDQEYLAAASEDEIHIWNLTKNTSRVAYKFQESGHWHLCAIDERTVCSIAQQPPSGHHFSNIYILNTDTEKFSLNSTIRMKADGTITDICYVKTADGTSCLILSAIRPSLIQCVEMVGGKMRWQVDTRQVDTQIGRSFIPWNICTDGNVVFVAEVVHMKLHLVSVDNGSVLTSINLSPFGFRYLGCMRLQGDHLFVGHMNKEATYCISKIIKPTDV